MIRCLNCSFENAVGHVFCENCGTALPVEPAAAPAAETTCATCGAATNAGMRFCEHCGAPVGAPAVTPPPPLPAASATRPVRSTLQPESAQSGKGVLIAGILIAALVGLGAGGYLFYRMQHRPVTQAAAPVSAPPPVIATTTPEPAAPVSDASPSPTPVVPAVTAETTPPERIREAPSAAPLKEARQTAPPPVPTPAPADAPEPQPDTHPHVAVQEPDATPAPTPPPSVPSAPDTTAPEPAAPEPVTPSAPAAPAYNGPRSGTAVWVGKLSKDEALTITGGTPSQGILTGAPLPGVPVQLSIVESNLGIGEMPNASNGYRRLVLKSHAKHEKITIRWTVR